MEKNKIIISVNGKSATGKSTFAWYILSKLKEEGFEIELSPELLKEYGSLEQFERSIMHDFDSIEERLKLFKNKTKFIISESQIVEPIIK